VKENLLIKVRSQYIENRVSSVDKDYLEFEELMITLSDLELIAFALDKGLSTLPNPFNSILLYVSGLSREFDFRKERSDTIEGSPPDVDLDYDTTGRSMVIEWAQKEWGYDKTAYVGTVGTYKPKSMIRDYYRITEGDPSIEKDLLEKVPPSDFGKEASLSEILELHPEIAVHEKYKPFLDFAVPLENVAKSIGIHAAGLIIADEPLDNFLPLWMKTDKEKDLTGATREIKKTVTQWDKKETQSVGGLKFDFLGIDNLSVIKSTIELVKNRRGISIDPYAIEDYDEKTYSLFERGLLIGVFQFETSGSIKKLAQAIKPESILELSDISAMHRPGPMQAGFDKDYVANKKGEDMTVRLPTRLADKLKETKYVLLYQEQVMSLVMDVADLTAKEADDVRRAMGSKNVTELDGYHEQFLIHGKEKGYTSEELETTWEILLGFADYGFNKSHAVAYSYISYINAWLKANYTVEFFCALMSVRSRTTQPKIWAEKAPTYISEAASLGVEILPPDINASKSDFEIGDDHHVYFGFNAIRGLNSSASDVLAETRGDILFLDFYDFMYRASSSKTKMNTIEALIHAGAFDTLNYSRSEILQNYEHISEYIRSEREIAQRKIEIEERNKEREALEKHRAEKALQLKEIETKLKGKMFLTEAEKYILDTKARLKRYRESESEAKSQGVDISEFLSPAELYEYRESKTSRLPVQLKNKELPLKPELHKLVRRERLTPLQLMQQAEAIGCFIGVHPWKEIFPRANPLEEASPRATMFFAGSVSNVRQVLSKKDKKEFMFFDLYDGVNTAEVALFPAAFTTAKRNGQLPKQNDIIQAKCRVQSVEEESIKLSIVDSVVVHKFQEEE